MSDVGAVAKHTPGPWRVKRGNAGADHPLFVVAPPTNDGLPKDGLRAWTDADAYLIAAAPELLEAAVLAADAMVKANRSQHSHKRPPTFQNFPFVPAIRVRHDRTLDLEQAAFEALVNAIAKAKGGSFPEKDSSRGERPDTGSQQNSPRVAKP